MNYLYGIVATLIAGVVVYVLYLRSKNRQLETDAKLGNLKTEEAVTNEKIAENKKEFEKATEQVEAEKKASEGQSGADFWKGKLK